MTYRILSFDGGGIRGLLSAMILNALTKDYPWILDQTDLFAGTSTGGLIALSLAHGKSPEDVITLYADNGDEIFEHWDPLTYDELGPGLIAAFYKNDNLSSQAQGLFGTTKLSELKRAGVPKNVAVCTTQLWDPNGLGTGNGSWMPRCFTNLPGSQFSELSAVDAALATSAAPGYFPPYPIMIENSDLGNFYTDGGLTANNPTQFAIDAVVQSGIAALEDIVVLSFGTGVSSYGIAPSLIANDPQAWGLDYWVDPFKAGADPACPLLELALGMNQQFSTLGAQMMLGDRIARVQPVIDPYPMDDWRHLSVLMTDATNYMVSTNDQWNAACEFVKTYWPAPLTPPQD